MKQNQKLFDNSMIVVSVLIVAICAIVFASLGSGGSSALKVKGTYAAGTCVCENPLSGDTKPGGCSAAGTCVCNSGNYTHIYSDNCSVDCPSGQFSGKSACQTQGVANGYYSCTSSSDGCWKRGTLNCYAGYSNSGGTCKKNPTTKKPTTQKPTTQKPTTKKPTDPPGSVNCCCKIGSSYSRIISQTAGNCSEACSERGGTYANSNYCSTNTDTPTKKPTTAAKKACYDNECNTSTNKYTSTYMGDETESACYGHSYCSQGTQSVCTWGSSKSGQCCPGYAEHPGTNECIGTDHFSCSIDLGCVNSVDYRTQTTFYPSVSTNPNGANYKISCSVSGSGNNSGSFNGTGIVIYALDKNGGTISVSCTASIGGKACASKSTTIKVNPCEGEDCTKPSPTKKPTGSSKTTTKPSGGSKTTTKKPAGGTTTKKPTGGTSGTTTKKLTTVAPGTYACYVVNGEYKWLNYQPTGGVIVRGVNSSAECHPVNPQTGTFGVIMAWIVGLGAIAYATYYFKSFFATNKD